MAKRKDLTGLKVGKLTVIEFAYRKKKRSYWKCQCECGRECIVRVDMLLSKKRPTSSCGCIKNEQIAKAGEPYRFKPTHGDTFTRFYRIYIHMLDRCNNPKVDSYKNYGAKGIKVEWKCYEDFKRDMYESYIQHVEEYGEDDTEIDRIDPKGNYCKDNCHWVTNLQQANNKRDTIYVELDNGELITMANLARELGVSHNTLFGKYYRSEYYSDDHENIRIVPYNVDIRPE